MWSGICRENYYSTPSACLSRVMTTHAENLTEKNGARKKRGENAKKISGITGPDSSDVWRLVGTVSSRYCMYCTVVMYSGTQSHCCGFLMLDHSEYCTLYILGTNSISYGRLAFSLRHQQDQADFFATSE